MSNNASNVFEKGSGGENLSNSPEKCSIKTSNHRSSKSIPMTESESFTTTTVCSSLVDKSTKNDSEVARISDTSNKMEVIMDFVENDELDFDEEDPNDQDEDNEPFTDPKMDKDDHLSIDPDLDKEPSNPDLDKESSNPDLVKL
uniref:Uncharacterized protein n=1 Tax=Cacopsylla melanoneura TaxID=428564 RepID=A0A8D8T826_9HEMI